MFGKCVFAACAAMVVSSTVHGQCADWRARGTGIYYQGVIRTSTTWDPDGAGPLPPVLVAAGIFDRIESVDGRVSRIAMWNGSAWQPLGAGVTAATPTGLAEVWALAVHNGELIAAGEFVKAGDASVSHIARWNGTAWQPLGAGIGGTPGMFPSVRALAVIDGQLIAGGRFTSAGGVAANNVAAWNGSQWSALGAGVGLPNSDVVQALANHNGELIAGGRFVGGHVARWNGLEWAPLGTGVDGNFGQLGAEVLALMSDGNDLIVGGRFKTAGGAPAKCLARWTGTHWLPMGTVNGAPDEFGPVVYSLSRFGGKVVAGGWFNAVDGAPANNVVSWTGTTWQPLGGGTSGHVWSLTPLGGDLIAGGWFLKADDAMVKSLARWNGTEWSDMPGVLLSSGPPHGYTTYALTPWAGSMVIGGLFPTSETDRPNLSFNLVAFDGVKLRDLGDPNAAVQVLATAPGASASTDLIAGGVFTAIGGVPARCIARLNDTIAGGWQPMGAGFNNAPAAIAVHNGSIYAAGDFTLSGTTALNRVARWDGSAWQPLGSGLNNAAFALASYSGSLYAGGVFTSAGGAPAAGLARWDGQSWSPVGSGFSGSVSALAVYDGDLVIGGQFAGVANSANVVAYNAGTNDFHAVGHGGGADAPIRAFTLSNGTLVAGGFFANIGGVPAKRLARWDGEVWRPIGGGVDAPVYALGTLNNEVHVAGPFSRVRNDVLYTPLWARFSEDGAPWIAGQPQGQVLACGSTFAPGLTPAAGYGGLVYQWRKNGVPLVDGPTGTGSTIAGATGNFGILNVSQADAGVYDCVISNACGSSTSRSATLTVTGNCPSACYANCDGSTTTPVLNINDFVCFLNKFAVGDPYANCDGSTLAPVLNVNDFVCYLNRFGAGCP